MQVRGVGEVDMPPEAVSRVIWDLALKPLWDPMFDGSESLAQSGPNVNVARTWHKTPTRLVAPDHPTQVRELPPVSA
jgi:hypothetical protein